MDAQQEIYLSYNLNTHYWILSFIFRFGMVWGLDLFQIGLPKFLRLGQNSLQAVIPHLSFASEWSVPPDLTQLYLCEVGEP